MNNRPAYNSYQLQLLTELAGIKCQCGSVKARNQSFCRLCWLTLSRPMQTALYKQVGAGYEDAYATAINYLVNKPGGGA